MVGVIVFCDGNGHGNACREREQQQRLTQPTHPRVTSMFYFFPFSSNKLVVEYLF